MDLKVQKRDKFGSQVAALRASGLIPAELYGHGIQNVHISVPVKDFRIAYKEVGENRLLNLVVDKETRPVLIQEVTKDPLTDELLSVDFYQVKMDEEIQTTVPIRFVGEAPAVKNLGGVLVKAMDEVKIKALPANIPAEITVDLSGLAELRQSIYVKDIAQSSKFKVMVDAANVIVTVSEQREEEEAPVAAPAIDQVVVEAEEKKAARDAAKAATATETK